MKTKTWLGGVMGLWVIGLCLSAGAIKDLPYEYYPYLADPTDVPPINYTKVCEPGRQGEKNASYIILGIPFPRTYPVVNQDYEGDLVLPAYIDELPVRKINDAGFLLCQQLRSVTLPSTLREIGERAFAWCISLTNVTFAEGLTSIGNSAFTNCVSLGSVTLPRSLAHLGEGCFARCNSMDEVHFLGNAPQIDRSWTVKKCPYLGEKWYDSAAPMQRIKVRIHTDTRGWVAPYETGVPEKWPVTCGYLEAHETIAEKPLGKGLIFHVQ